MIGEIVSQVSRLVFGFGSPGGDGLLDQPVFQVGRIELADHVSLLHERAVRQNREDHPPLLHLADHRLALAFVFAVVLRCGRKTAPNRNVNVSMRGHVRGTSIGLSF